MGGSQSRAEVQPPKPPEEDELDEGLAVGEGELRLTLRDETGDADDAWDSDFDDGASPLSVETKDAAPTEDRAVAFVVEDSSKIVMRSKPDAGAPEHPHIPAPPAGTSLSGTLYAINSQDWIQLEEPCKGFWVTRAGLKQR